MNKELCKFCEVNQECTKLCKDAKIKVEPIITKAPPHSQYKYEPKGVPFLSYAESRREKKFQQLNFK